jgi:hypothetical protein
MENQTKSMNAGRRRNSNRSACFYRRNRNRLSGKEPVLIGHFLDRLLDETGKVNREKLVKQFNT